MRLHRAGGILFAMPTLTVTAPSAAGAGFEPLGSISLDFPDADVEGPGSRGLLPVPHDEGGGAPTTRKMEIGGTDRVYTSLGAPAASFCSDNTSIAKFATTASWIVNWFLLIVKVYLAAATASKSILAALVDSAVDLVSQAILAIADRCSLPLSYQ